ncbi:MAG TPA: TadE/TadG family type IV pilus assembly protein [Hyphomicrobium sp.]|nr:TadE/TadG family type IV pilus assembly protein [Hyphomicrobium sp.]
MQRYPTYSRVSDRLVRQAASLASRLWRDTSANSAIEFALLAPLVLLMLLGTIEAGRAINIERHFTSAVQTAGDLVAREEFLGTSKAGAQTNLDAMMQSIRHLMQPYNSDGLAIGIFSVQASSKNAGDTKVIWNYAYKNKKAVPGECSSYTLPNHLVEKGGSVIVVDAEYTYDSIFGRLVPGFGALSLFKDKSFHSPRNSTVEYVKGDNGVNRC